MSRHEFFSLNNSTKMLRITKNNIFYTKIKLLYFEVGLKLQKSSFEVNVDNIEIILQLKSYR